MKKILFFLLAVIITAITSAQTINVTSPNGGETWAGCSSRTITWTHSGTSGFFNVEYSTNNGSTWASLANSYSGTSLTWTVPNVSSSQALVRVYDYNNNSITDQSNATFTITPALIITSPNGGESWQVANPATRTITWDGFGTSNSFLLEYSTNGGSAWTTIVSTTFTPVGNSYSYTWTVPNTPSAFSLIRITDNGSACKSDVSDNVFTIAAPIQSITVTSPNGGNTLYINQSHTITWNCAYLPTNFVKIEYSTNNGTTWSSIINSTATGSTSGSYNWTPIPNTPSNTCLVRVKAVADTTVKDVSDAIFNIALGSITVSTPNGGESWNGCTAYNVLWTRTGTSNYFNIDYTTNNGTSWSSLATNYYQTATNCSFTWTVPNVSSSQAKVRVYDYNNSAIRDSSDAVFTINPALIVTSPNGGESWQGGTSKTITWSQGPGATNYWTIQYSTDGGNNWTNIVYNTYITTGQYVWNPVANVPSSSCLIRIFQGTSASDCRMDVSDNLFAITPATPVITVTNPTSSGITYYVGGTYTINWTYQYVTGSFVKIEYSTNNGSTWNSIVNNTSISTGSYSWTPVPNTPSANCLVRVKSNNGADSLVATDVSDNVFNIVYPYVTVNVPNGGESWLGCSSQTISWTPYQYGSATWKVEYSMNNGGNWNTLVSSTSATSYTWNPVIDSFSNQALVRVTKTTDALVTDNSNAVFTIRGDSSIIITSPNGGESWQVANPATRNITWTYNTSTSGPYFYLQYSIDGGNNWTYLNGGNYVTGSAGNGSYTWTIPNTPSTNVLVKVIDYYVSCKNDVSDAPFTILAPNPVMTVTSPSAAGITYYVGGTYSINWTYQYVPGSFVKIEYSTNNGSTWTSIVNNTSISAGTYTWTNVPNTPSSQCLIRVKSTGADSLTVSDVSDNNFSIVYPYLVVNSPNGGESWQGCSSQTISWTPYQYGSGTYRVEYSTDNGVTWTVLVASTSSTSYNWNPVPNINASQTLVRVTKTTDALVTDVSNTTFNLAQQTFIVVNSPNGGENWQVSNPTTRTITWAYNPSISGPYFYLYYSTDGGASYSALNGGNYVTGSAGNGSYTWTIPNTPSTNVLVKIVDYYSTCKFDVSDAVFTIQAPTPVLTVTTPSNAGITYYVGGTYNINWTQQYVPGSFVKIEYSTNNGASWTSIINSTSIATGTYSWVNVPNTPSNNCLVRVKSTGADSLTVFDISDNNFSIVYPYVIVGTPNGGEQWLGCGSQTISWTPYQYGSATWKVEYSMNNGGNWNTLVASTSATSYTWSPIIDSFTNQALVRVTKTTDALVTDNSNAVFTIRGDSSILITSPNGGQNWQVGGANQTISWTYNTSLAGPYFYLQYSTDGGTNWTYLNGGNYVTASGGNGSFSWVIPNTPSTNVLVKVIDYYNNPCRNDVSDAPFTISTATPVITVTTPNGGNTFYVGGTYNINWTYQYVTGSFVKIEYSTNNGATWSSIVNNTSISTGTYSWTPIPNTPSSQCLVRVKSTTDSLVATDVSNAVFNIVYPYVTVAVPNGGEQWLGCGSQTISWTGYQYGSATWKVEYSLNNGGNWNTLVASTSSTSYTWSPIIDSFTNQALVRVTKTTDTVVRDASNAVFTIRGDSSIAITSPNGGENWQVSNPATRTVTWTYNTSLAGPYFYVLYSTDGGATWTYLNGGNYVTGSAGNGSYTWTVPNTPTTNALVKVIDYYNDPCRNDISDAPFTISSPTPVLTLTAPNGGNIYYVGSSYNITWTSQYLTSSFVKLEYSIDNGTNWIVITNATNNDGTETWITPNNPSTTCLVRVSEYGNPSLNDVSNAVFSIVAPYITVNAPNGSETWNGCTSQTISWTGYGTSGPYMVEYSIDGGTNWSTLVSSTSSTSYSWATVPNINSSQTLVRVSLVSNSAVNDISNAAFNLSQQIHIIVNSPNGGEVWQCNNPATRVVNWAYNPANSGPYFYLYYSTNGGSTWTALNGGNYVTGSGGNGNYTWTIPNTPSNNCLIKVEDYYSSCKYDVSDLPFTITAPTPNITVTYPNGNETLYGFNTTSIQWTSAYISSSFVKIEYSIDSGATWLLISGSASNNGVYSWTVPNITTTKALVRVTDYGNNATYDVSNAVFTIKPAVVVTAPNGGENLSGCTVTTITWNGEGSSGSYLLQYSVNGGTSWNTIVSQTFSASPATLYSYNWTLPNTPSNYCLVRVTNNNNTSKVDQSDAVFNILPTITVTNPNNGGSYSIGSTLNITWASQGVSNYYNIEYSTNGGSVWNTITFNTYITTNSYAWTVPNAPSTNCYIRVTDNNNNCKQDINDVAFTISTTPPAITVTSPNGGENITACSTRDITWSANGTSGSYTIEYSSNNGSTWTTLVSNYATTNGTYSWTVPSVATTQGLIRVKDFANASLIDQSNSVFAISVLATPGTITGSATACEGSSQTYSIALVSGATSYTWTLPAGWSGSSTSNTISVIAGSASGNISVVANNTCGSSSASTKAVTVSPLPATPGSISTTNSSPCTGNTVTYSIAAVSGATSYSWILPSGFSGSSTTTSIAVLIGANPGVIQVSANNSCGSGGVSSLTVTPNGSSLPATPTSISGTLAPCAGTSQTYSILPVAGATSYSWTLPAGWSGSSSTNSINVTSGSVGGNISVTANNACGTSAAQTLTVSITNVPAQPGTISGNASVCLNSANTYTISAVSGAGNYTWSLPSGWSGASTSTSINSVATGITGSVQVTANNACGSSTPRTLAVTVNSPVTPTVTASTTASGTICANASITFTATQTNGGTPTYQWIKNNVAVGTNSAFYTATGWSNNDSVWVIMTSSSTCLTTATATSNKIYLSVNPNVTPTISISASTTSICANGSVAFTSSITNGGASPTYQWKKNGVNISGATSSTYSTTSLANGDAITCLLTSTATCASPANVTSNSISITVTSNVTPTVTIVASPSGAICAGTSVTFTATPTNGGTTPTYVWTVNGYFAGNGSTYTASNLIQSDTVRCQLTSNVSCVTTPTANSNAIIMTVNQYVNPVVTISANNNPICTGQAVTFTATPTNGGASPTYQWYKNNALISGATLATYTASGIVANDSFFVRMVSNYSCLNTTVDTSNVIAIAVTGSVTPSVTIAVSPNDTVCAGTSLTFTATPLNGGSTPTYVWKKNGTTISGATAATYTVTTLVNNDVITVVMTSSSSCASPTTATSNAITITVNANVTASVTASGAPVSPICSGTSVTFTATPTNGGVSPSYQWRLNGSAISGQTGSTYTTTSLASGDVVSVQMSSSAQCATPTTATSGNLTYTVNPVLVPGVTVTAGSNPICAGSSTTFTATPLNGGTPTYQWKKNGTNVGTGLVTYSPTTLNDGDSVWVVMTSTATCATPTTVTSNKVIISTTPTVTPSVSISVSPANSICSGQSVTFTATPTNGGTTPTYVWKKNGTTIAGATASTYTSTALVNNDVITVVMTSNANCASPATATSNAITMSVSSNSAPTVSIAALPTGAICSGTSVTFTATPTNGGATPTYDWRVNGVSTGVTTATYTSASLANTNQISCVLTSSLTCVTTTTATSNTITMTVNPVLTPSVLISTPNQTICAGTSVTFTAAPTNGGTPTYVWKKNGTSVGVTTSTYTTTTIANNDIVTVEMTSTSACASPATVTSNSIAMTVNPAVTPTISISANQTSICAGNTVSFTSTVTNGGAGPSYQWKKNGTNISGATAATYSSASLVNNDVITCVLTSNANCASPATATSNTVTITVVTNATPTVSISASANPACSGLPVTFTATPVNGGSTPAYDWKLNGTSTGITTATYTTSSLVTGNQVSCVMISSLSCVSTSSATSNTVTMTVNPTVTPSVLITTPNNSVCSGVNVTFTAAPTNGGTTPGYQWKKNGINISGANSVTYSSSTLANGDIITVEMTSAATCASPAVVTSNSIVLTVTTSVTPSISIAANPSGAVCAGTSVSFTATPINGGITPAYQWKKNGTNISGATTSTYSSSSLVSGDVITCQLTSSAACATPAVVTSTGITMTVNAVVTPTVSISANTGTSICSGTNVTFSTTVTNGGATPTYQWKLNGNVVGIGSTYSNAALSNGDAVTCDIVSNAVCVTQSTATSNTLTMSVNGSVNPTIAISASTGNTICSGTSVVFSSLITGGGSTPAYQWRKGGVAISGATSATYTTSALANNDAITCVLTSSAGCASPASVTSNTITMSVSNTVTASVSINASATSVCSGTNISFAATPVNGGANPVYNWKVNGVSTGVSAAVYTSSSLSSGDVVSCDMSSTLNCVTPALTTSNAITITVNPVVTPSVSISTPNTTICSGTSVSFTATSVNGGANPVYTWKVNGNSVGSSANFTSASLNNSDIITCDLTSNAACITQTNASSNAITMTVTSSVTPTIIISANPGNSVCAGTPVTFTATATNGGATPVYQWKKNGSFVGSNSDTYTASNLNNNDVISVTLNSSSTCAIPASVTNTLTMTIKPIPTAPTASANSPMCEGNVLQLSCASVAGASSYEWSGPVSYQSFLQNPTITGASTVNSGTYSVVVTVNGCSSQPGTVNVVINAKPATPTISQNGNVLTSSAASSYQWYLNSGVLSGATQQSYTVTQTGWYSVEVSNTQSCSSISDSLYVVATSIEAVNLDKVINIVPNPFITQFEIKVSTSVQNMNGWSVTITDELGRQVYVNRQLDYINYVDLSNHASGIYFVNLNTGKERRTFKVVKTE